MRSNSRFVSQRSYAFCAMWRLLSLQTVMPERDNAVVNVSTRNRKFRLQQHRFQQLARRAIELSL